MTDSTTFRWQIFGLFTIATSAIFIVFHAQKCAPTFENISVLNYLALCSISRLYCSISCYIALLLCSTALLLGSISWLYRSIAWLYCSISLLYRSIAGLYCSIAGLYCSIAGPTTLIERALY